MTTPEIIQAIQAISDRADALEQIRVTHDQQIATLQQALATATAQTNTAIADKIIAAGLTLAKFNIPYAFGGDTFAEGGLDCSGFTRLLYQSVAGITLPRISADQSRFGTAVTIPNARKGDLLFFTYNDRNNGLPTHVGIYMGDNKMLHTNNDKERIHVSQIDLNTTTAIRRVL